MTDKKELEFNELEDVTGGIEAAIKFRYIIQYEDHNGKPQSASSNGFDSYEEAERQLDLKAKNIDGSILSKKIVC